MHLSCIVTSFCSRTNNFAAEIVQAEGRTSSSLERYAEVPPILCKIVQAERNDASSRSLSFAKIHTIIETTNK